MLKQEFLNGSPIYQDAVVGDLDVAIGECGRATEDFHRVACALKSRRNVAHCSIFRLPDELLEEIFSLSTPTDRESNGNLGLAQVCARWRKVALGSPRLWSRVVVDCSTSTPLLDELLRRSGSYPLNMELYMAHKSSSLRGHPHRVKHFSEVLPLAVSALPRTRHLHVASMH